MSLSPLTLACRGLSAGYGRRQILRQLSLQLPPGKLSVLVGANGCGKSTLLNVLAGQLQQSAGEVLLGERRLEQYSAKQRSRELALLPQHPQLHGEMNVFEVVRLGRFPHQSLLQQWSEEDAKAVKRALELTGLTELADRPLHNLSGGQQQRAWIALVLAQDSPIILLDEPINHLDINHQVEVLDLLAQLSSEGKTIGVVLHDINLACRYGDHLIALREGRIYRQGAPAQVVDEQLLVDVFNQPARIITDPVYGTPLAIPLGRSQQQKEALAS